MALSSDLKFANNLRNLKLVLACAITLVASHLLLFVLAAVDIAHELRDDTKELNDRIASIVNYNHKIADKLSTALFNFLWVRSPAFCSPVNRASISGITTQFL